MAAYVDRVQALMDEVYNEWQKDENKNKGKWDVLEGFSEAHQIAVVFGNFNQQVENGGISQWIYNGYFHEDAEKLAGYLETGAQSDERFKKILGDIYQFDAYAHETDCDRYGYFHDRGDEDGEGGFIGDIIDCDAFDTWYYEHCGDDWWKTVCGIIDKAAAHETAHDKQEERPISGEANPPHPLQVYIENARDTRIGGFTMPLPATAADLQPFFEGADINSPLDIKIGDVMSNIPGLGDAVMAAVNQSMKIGRAHV
jgi:hypothetical protein